VTSFETTAAEVQADAAVKAIVERVSVVDALWFCGIEVVEVPARFTIDMRTAGKNDLLSSYGNCVPRTYA